MLAQSDAWAWVALQRGCCRGSRYSGSSTPVDSRISKVVPSTMR